MSSEMGFAADARGGEEAQVEIYIYIYMYKEIEAERSVSSSCSILYILCIVWILL